MESLQFLKMSASANDFIIFDNREGRVDRLFPDTPDFVRKVCRRRHSVGADGLILIEKSATVDFAWRFYNADGSVAEMCGNGGRCAARFAYLKGIAGERMAFATLAGTMKAEVHADGTVKLQLTAPQDLRLDYPIHLDDKELFVSSVNTGVPHAILLTDHVDGAPVEKLGRPIRRHKMFPKGTNVDFVEIVDRENVRIRTYERGVEGETTHAGPAPWQRGSCSTRKGSWAARSTYGPWAAKSSGSTWTATCTWKAAPGLSTRELSFRTQWSTSQGATNYRRGRI